jgi:hypothetical protein
LTMCSRTCASWTLSSTRTRCDVRMNDDVTTAMLTKMCANCDNMHHNNRQGSPHCGRDRNGRHGARDAPAGAVTRPSHQPPTPHPCPAGYPQRCKGAGGAGREGEPGHADGAATDARWPERRRRLRAAVKHNRNPVEMRRRARARTAFYGTQRVARAAGAIKRRTLAAWPTRTTTTPR